MTEPQVRRANRDEVPELAAVLARAFARDPFFSYLTGDAPERNLRMRLGWTGILRHASAGLRETWTTDDRAGVAIWIPPGHRASTMLASLRLTPAMLRLTGGGRIREVSAAIETLDRRRRVHAPVPHWYLSALGVDPSRQGQGIGSALLESILHRADRDGTPTYLETATARNVLLYERYRFDVVEELILPRTDVRGWLMLRSPAPATAGADRPPAGRSSPTGSG